MVWRAHERDAVLSAPIDQSVAQHDRGARCHCRGLDRARTEVRVGVEVARLAGQMAELRDVGAVMNTQQLLLAGRSRRELAADEAGIGVVAYISMAFGNPYGDMWSEEKVAEAAGAITGMGVNSLSLADTIGAAEPDLIHRVVSAALRDCEEFEVGVHLHSTPAGARAKVLAAYDAGCRRFDSAIGGLGGCPFAQDKLVGNVPTEEVLGALQERGLNLPIDPSKVAGMNSAISGEFF